MRYFRHILRSQATRLEVIHVAGTPKLSAPVTHDLHVNFLRWMPATLDRPSAIGRLPPLSPRAPEAMSALSYYPAFFCCYWCAKNARMRKVWWGGTRAVRTTDFLLYLSAGLHRPFVRVQAGVEVFVSCTYSYVLVVTVYCKSSNSQSISVSRSVSHEKKRAVDCPFFLSIFGFSWMYIRVCASNCIATVYPPPLGFQNNA